MKTIIRNIQGFELSYHIGQNAAENFEIIDNSEEHDLWFHIESAPSCHVVVSLENHKYDKKQLHKIAVQGAILCKQYSRYKSDKNICVVYCRICDIIKSKEFIGTVHIVGKYKTITI